MRYLLTSAAALALAACGGADTQSSTDAAPAADTPALIEEAVELAPADETAAEVAGVDWGAILTSDRRGENHADRDQYRHPQETMAFFGVEPGMTVAEAQPGGGWYTRLLLPLLGADGGLIGVNYAPDMVVLFGDEVSEEFVEETRQWPSTWPATTEEWSKEGDAPIVGAYSFGAVDAAAAGSADVFLMIRALHNVNRYEANGGYRTTALKDAFDLLKPGGVLGVVQHAGPETNDDAWATGQNGYLKQSQVVAAIEAAGFEFVEASDVNANPKDQPTNEDYVWRLPPSLDGGSASEERAAAMKAIGESNRMTLKFVKPAS
ncbi:MAG: methyltransferase [Pseudomonadota bacterium]